MTGAVGVHHWSSFVQNRNTQNQTPVNILSPLGDFDRKEQNSIEFLEAFRGFLPEEVEQWRKESIPQRSPKATAKQLDLTPFYNADLNTSPHVGRNLAEATGNNLKQMPQGLLKFNGVLFDVRGLVVLNSKNLTSPPAIKEVPARINGIPVNQLVRCISFIVLGETIAKSRLPTTELVRVRQGTVDPGPRQKGDTRLVVHGV